MRSLERLPPLVSARECDQLKARLASVARGEAFLLQGGDCAETFAGTTADSIRGKLRTLLQMSVVLTYAASVPVVKVGRMAGQFGKPRSAATEARDGAELPVYRGDAVNATEFTAAARTPDPGRLLDAYHCSAVTLNLCRAFASGGYADLGQVHAWNQDFVARSPAGQRYEQLAQEIDRAIAFMHACGADPEEFRAVEFYSSHEALLLDYERALTSTDSRTGLSCDLSAHLLWIGERTRALDGAHIEFARQIRNPVAVKIGPAVTAPDVLALADVLDPNREPGLLTLITRMGAGRVRDVLPPLVEKVAASGAVVAWVCDPMHGNTIEASGHKTRHFDDVLDEVTGSSRCTKRWAPIRVASTSSSPATTSPNAWAAGSTSRKATCAAGTRPPATPGSTAASPRPGLSCRGYVPSAHPHGAHGARPGGDSAGAGPPSYSMIGAG